MDWLKVRVVEQLEFGFGRDLIVSGSTAWVARKNGRVRVYTDDDRINDLDVSTARNSLEYVRAGEHFIRHPSSDQVDSWYLNAWNKLMY